MRIGILSFAHIHAESYADILKSREDVDFIGFFDDDLERGKEISEKFQIPFFEELEAFFAQKPEAVIICSENARHKYFAELAAESACSVLCEKPLATSVEDARFMVDLFHEKKLLLMTAFPMRYSIPVVEAKKLIDSGGLGLVYCVNSCNQGKLPRNLRSWFVDKELAGGGAVSDHLVHLTDIFRWIFQKEVHEIFARSNRNLHADDPDLEVETAGLAMISFKDGPFVSIDCSWSRPQGYPIWGGLRFELIGEKGNLNVDAFKQTMQFYSEKSQPEWLYWGSNADSMMIDDFILSHSTGNKPRVSGEDGLKAVEVVQAAYRSIDSGQAELIL
jgi:predicted dehydrogenase